MQNLPLLNTQNAAPKANVQGGRTNNTQSNNILEQSDEGGSFQQKLMQQIHQKNNGAQHPQNQPARKTEAAQDKTIDEKDTATNDFISRKIKGLVGKTASSEVKDTSPANTDKTAQDAIVAETDPNTAAVDETASVVDSTLIPASLNVLAQLQQATKSAAAPALENAQGDLNSEPALAGDVLATSVSAEGDESSIISPDKAGIDKLALEKTTLDKVAGNQHAQSEDFASAMSDSVNKASVAKEPIVSMVQNQPVSAAQTAAANLANNSMIMVPPGKEGWNQAIGQRVMWMVGAAQQSATLTLNPPEMGPLQVVINVHNDKADTTFFSDRQEVRQALQDGMDNLREMMKEAGINLGQTNINQRDKSAQDFMQQQQAAMQKSANSGETIKESPVSTAPVRAGLGLVDTFA